jgi:hypothetical protein
LIGEERMVLRFGELLYRYAGLGKILTYTVQAFINRQEGMSWEVECQECTHGEKCRLIIRQEGDSFVFVEMIDEDPVDPQKHWHEDGVYRLTKNEALKDCVQITLDGLLEKRKKAKETVYYLDKEIGKCENIIYGMVGEKE